MSCDNWVIIKNQLLTFTKKELFKRKFGFIFIKIILWEYLDKKWKL